MKINKLELFEFRCFADYQITFADRFNLLIGDNGCGKSAILEALAVAAGGFLLEIPGTLPNEKRHIQKDDVRYVSLAMGQTPIKFSEYQTMVWAQGYVNQQKVNWARYRDKRTNRKDSNQITKVVEQLVETAASPTCLLPAIAYYGTGRLWKQLKSTEKKTLGLSTRFDGYQDCLNPASDQKRLFSWFKTQELAALQKQETRHTLEAVRQSIISMIPDAKWAVWDLDWDELRIELDTDNTPKNIPFRLLSDGYRNMIGMVADIAYRMAMLNPQLESQVIQQTEGMILIDEIDLHLHPIWQRKVVEQLLKTFPKVQFIATTHSPFVIQALYGKEDCMLWDIGKQSPFAVESKSIEDIAENQQGVEIPQQSQHFLDMSQTALQYYELLKALPDSANEQALALKNKLDELQDRYSDDPAYRAFLKMERLAAEKAAELSNEAG